MDKSLPKELRSLVDWAVTALGDTIRVELGARGFQRIERIRRHVKSAEGQKLKGLQRLKKDLEKLSSQERFEVAHSFALMLEIINSCEAAYRTFRLRAEYLEKTDEKHHFGRVIHVLTAHPTESRSPDVIYFFRRIQDVLERRLEKTNEHDEQELKTYLTWVWRVPMSKQRKPSVMDEAEYIYSLALQKDVIDLYIKQSQAGLPFYIRTWVGGDKDGHPGVDEKSMLGSLQMSRGFIIKWLEEKWDHLLSDMEPMAHTARGEKEQIRKFIGSLKKSKKDLRALKRIKHGDARHVQKWVGNLKPLQASYQKMFKQESLDIKNIISCTKVFPGLVVPLELREDSGLVHQALKAPTAKFAISRMLHKLDKLTLET